MSGAASESQRAAPRPPVPPTDVLKTAAVQRTCERLGDRLLVLDEQHRDHVWIGPVHLKPITTMAAPRKASIKD